MTVSASEGSVCIIAEAGVNHDGDVRKACALIDAAVAAGADIVKFQSFVVDAVVTPAAPKAAYQVASTAPDESLHAMLTRLQLTPTEFTTIADHCRAQGIEFLATAFDAESLALICSLGIRRLKVPSGEITNVPYLRAIAAHRLPVLLSTGMSTLAEVSGAVGLLREAGVARDQITVLHCTSAYPTPMADVNLRAMTTMGAQLGLPVGYSDHTPGWEVSVAAVALGAIVIEKHLTLNRHDPGPDHAASLEPAEFAAMVRAVRNVTAALGDGVKAPQPSEVETAQVSRRSITASTAIRAGEILTPDNITTRRPGTGISPLLWDEVIGSHASRDFLPGEAIDFPGEVIENPRGMIGT